MPEQVKTTDPFQRLSARAVNPYELAHNLPPTARPVRPEMKNWREFFEDPPIGLDGGILLPIGLLQSVQGSIVGDYLNERTIPTGRHYAVTHDADDYGIPHIHSNGKTPSFYTSRGYPYYNANIKFNVDDKDVRRKALQHNLEQDAHLMERWSEVRKETDMYEGEDRWRLMNSLFQNIANDLIGLDYALSIARMAQPDLAGFAREYSREIFKTATLYYKNLLGHDLSYAEEYNILERVRNAPQVIREIEWASPDFVDDIRTRRETDATFLTLSAAATFAGEFGDDKRTVVLPKLGSYDLGPALAALGYEGTLHYILPSQKTIGTEKIGLETFSRQAGIQRDFEVFIREHGAENGPVVVFDDSLASGSTLMHVIEACKRSGLAVDAIRTMFANSHPERLMSRAKFDELYGPVTDTYYETPLVRKQTPEKQFLHPRVMSARWIKQAQQST